jgi:hypothetical protein
VITPNLEGQVVENLSGADADRPASQAALSREISGLVSRLVGGEALDTAACGSELAARFPDVGMTGDMIAEAIVRAAGMVGMIRQGAGPGAAGSAGSSASAPAAEEVAVELGSIAVPARAEPDHGLERAESTPIARGALAAFRRALLRD